MSKTDKTNAPRFVASNDELIKAKKKTVGKTLNEILKFNPYHGYHGYFSSANAAGAKVSLKGKTENGQRLLNQYKERHKDNSYHNSSGSGSKAMRNPTGNFDEDYKRETEGADFAVQFLKHGNGIKLSVVDLHSKETVQNTGDPWAREAVGNMKIATQYGNQGKIYMIDRKGATEAEKATKSKGVKNGSEMLRDFEQQINARALRTLDKEYLDQVDAASSSAKKSANIDTIEEVTKFNPYHGYHGYFSTAEGATSMTARTKYGPGQKAIANIKAKATGEGLNKYPMGNIQQKNHKSADGIDTYLNDEDYPPKPDATTYRKVTKDLQISEEQAKAMAESIYRYASYDYKEIRASSRGENDSYKTEAENCEEFIKASPKWAGGKIYRGIKINNDADLHAIMDKASKGQPIDMRGISSWSTEQSIAEEFATDYSESGFIHSVVFVTNGTSTKNGTSVKHLSRYKDENEVLVSKDAVFTPTKIEAAGGTIYIYGNMP